MGNFTLTDVQQLSYGTLALAPFLLAPGYWAVWASNALEMRCRGWAEQLLLSLVFSFAVTPVLAVWLLRLAGFALALPCFLILAAAAVIHVAWRWRAQGSPLPLRRSTRWLLLACVAWFLLAVVSMVDLQIDQHLYLSYTFYDRTVRLPLINAIARSGIPASNPFFGIKAYPPVRYFYYWYAVCALPVRYFCLSAKGVFDASVVWTGFALAALVPLFLKHVLGLREGLRRTSIVGIALLAVTGLDLIPYLIISLKSYAVAHADLEWWDPNQVTSWLASLLWVPHHLAGLIACMASFLLLAQLDERTSPQRRVTAVWLSAAAFASAAGLSLYVTFAYVIFAACWTLYSLRRGEWRSFLTWAAAGVLSLLLSLPYLRELIFHGGAAEAESTGRFAILALREPPRLLDPFGEMHITNKVLAELSKLPGMFLTYVFEFGFFGLVLYLCARRDLARKQPLERPRAMLWCMLGSALLAMSVIKSDTTGVNDLGFRGVLLVQFVLLVLAAPLVVERFAHPPAELSLGRLALVFTLTLGLCGSLYEAFSLRCYSLMVDSGMKVRDEWWFGSPSLGDHAYWQRRGFTELEQKIPANWVVQYDPTRNEYMLSHVLSGHQAAMGEKDCNVAFGGDLRVCQSAYPDMFAAYNGLVVMHRRNLDDICRRYNIQIMVAEDVDAVWKDRDSWVWKRPALVSNLYFRAIPCGSGVSILGR